MNFFQRLALLALLPLAVAASASESARATIARAILAPDSAETRTLVSSLTGNADEAIPVLFEAWRTDQLFVHREGPTPVAVQLIGDKDEAGARAALRVDTGEPLADASGRPVRINPTGLKSVSHTTSLRRAMKGVLDIFDLVSPDPNRRLKAVQAFGLAQDSTKLATLQERLPLEQNARVVRVMREAIALIRLKDPKDEVKLAALAELKAVHTLSSTDFLQRVLKEAEEAKNEPVAAAARSALYSVESHRSTVDFMGTIFRGISLGSILLVAAV
jgi:urea transport system permease protein